MLTQQSSKYHSAKCEIATLFHPTIALQAPYGKVLAG